MMDRFEFFRFIKDNNIKEYGKDIYRKQWIKDWRQVLFCRLYFDVDIFDMEDILKEYCLKNDLMCLVDGGYFCVVCNRFDYNEIERLYSEYRFDD